MDTSAVYIKMCEGAVICSDIRDIFTTIMSPEMKLGTIICFRSFMGMIVFAKQNRDENSLANFFPETLAVRIWCEKNQDLNIISTGHYERVFGDTGFPLFRQDQLQEMVKDEQICLDNPAMWDGRHWSVTIWGDGESYHLEGNTAEQVLLMAVMELVHNKTWDGEKWVISSS